MQAGLTGRSNEWREPNGLSTHTYDAVDDAIRLLVRQAPRTRDRRLLKRAVIVVTDGFPVGDTVSAETVIERANQADVSVYTVTLPSYSRVITTATQSPLLTLSTSANSRSAPAEEISTPIRKTINNSFAPWRKKLLQLMCWLFIPQKRNAATGSFTR